MPGEFEPLLETAVANDPIEQFDRWFADAGRELRIPEAMALATTDLDLNPSARMVLARGWDERGFVFYTDYRSRKSSEIDANPRGALLFYWDPPGRQVRIEGRISRVSDDESDRYFASRPQGSQLAAHASVQSRPIDSRASLDRRFSEEETRLEGSLVPRPSWWGGFRLTPEAMEFWQLGRDRLHDRLLYSRTAEGWRVERLQP